MTKREKQLIDDCILLLIPELEMNAAFKIGKNTSKAISENLKPFKLKAIAKIEERINKLKDELND